MDGWIKIHRKLFEWEWWDKSEMIHIFIYFLLKANFEKNKWHGIQLKRGQFVTSIKSISKSTNLSSQVIRTCINRLKLTNEITIKSTNKFSIITICNYENYQISENKANKQITNKQQTNNNQLTTDKKEKNVNKDNKDNNKEIFNEVLKLYKGIKKGLETEFTNFTKKHKDWNTILPLLKPAVENQIKLRKQKEINKEFVPSWKHFQTWINQRSWEEVEEIETKKDKIEWNYDK